MLPKRCFELQEGWHILQILAGCEAAFCFYSHSDGVFKDMNGKGMHKPDKPSIIRRSCYPSAMFAKSPRVFTILADARLEQALHI